MFNQHVTRKLSAYCHGELTPEEARRVDEHLPRCERCRKEYDEIKFGVELAQRLPARPAPEGMWSEIEALLETTGSQQAKPGKKPWWAIPTGGPRWAPAAALLLLAIGIGTLWYFKRPARASWEVARLDGAPQVGPVRIGGTARLAVGEWLETDDTSRAKINVGQIGQVEIDPNTRVRLVQARLTEHRLALARGTLHAKIYAPPRLFFVDTPSAVAVDLGCAYTLEVDDAGTSVLYVTMGWVALARDGRESIVPSGAVCATRPGIGPGTPYFVDASDAFLGALAKLDFAKGGREALAVVLTEARPRDTLTIWHLLPRVDATDRTVVYDRLAALVPPPAGVTRDGVLRLDAKMLDHWKDKLEDAWFLQTEDPAWRKAWRKVWKYYQN